MSLKSLLKKASMSLGGILLACNINCATFKVFDSNSFQTNVDEKRPIDLEDKVSSERLFKPKQWQIPVNILGAYLLGDFTHEGGHALAALGVGMEIENFHPIRFIPGKYSEYAPIWVKVTNESYLKASDGERAIYHIAGPVADMASAEIINYNLRHGKISEKYQPFWATTGLVYRWHLLWNAIHGTKRQLGNDFYEFAENTGVSEETSLGIVALYTALSAKRIGKEFKVALGKDTYDYKPKKGELNLTPVPNGLALTYSVDF